MGEICMLQILLYKIITTSPFTCFNIIHDLTQMH